MDTEPESREARETFNPHSVVLATTTLYPKWYPGEARTIRDVEKVRGDLALGMIGLAKERGYQVVVVEDGSSEEFGEELKRKGIEFHQGGKGMGAGRRKTLEVAGELEGVQVIVWIEPEKAPLVKDCIEQAVAPIFEGQADIVVPKRDEASFDTYPKVQARYELKGNRLLNRLLRKRGLLKEEDPDIDFWFGPRIFENKPEISGLFQRRYEFVGKKEMDAGYNPELWSGILVLPIIAALNEGYRVMSVEVPYRHPPEQTLSEKENSRFEEKRRMQYQNFINVTRHFLMLLDSDPKIRFKRIEYS